MQKYKISTTNFKSSLTFLINRPKSFSKYPKTLYPQFLFEHFRTKGHFHRCFRQNEKGEKPYLCTVKPKTRKTGK